MVFATSDVRKDDVWPAISEWEKAQKVIFMQDVAAPHFGYLTDSGWTKTSLEDGLADEILQNGQQDASTEHHREISPHKAG